MNDDKRFSRREVLVGVAATGVAGYSLGATTVPVAPVLTLSAGFAPKGKYIFQQPLLFQRAHARTVSHTYVNGLGQTITVDANLSTFDGLTGAGAHWMGSTRSLLCAASRRPWANAGGDWLDSNGTAQGNVPFSSSATLAGGSAAGSTNIDVTNAVKWIWSKQHWCAFFLRTNSSGSTQFIGALNPSQQPGKLTVQYSDGQSDVFDCWYTASLRGSTAYTNAQEPLIDFDSSTPALLEFYRASVPDERISTNGKTPVSATLALARQAVSGSNLRIDVYVVNPLVPQSVDPRAGLAAAYTLDSGINANAAVAASLCVTDTDAMGNALDEARSGNAYNPWLPNSNPYGNRSEATFDPNLWTATPGQGDFANVPAPTEAQRNAMYPRRVQTAAGTKLVGNVSRKQGKATQDAIRLVHGNDTLARARGFSPLAPGLGALEFMYGGGDVLNGQSTLMSQTLNTECDLDLLFKEQHIGRVVDGYLRMYVLLGDGWDASDNGNSHQFYAPSGNPSDMGKYPEQLGVDPQTANWRRLDRTGKFPGGIQQVTSGHTAYRRYSDPLRTGSTAQVTDLTGGGYSSTSGIHGYQGRWMFWQGYYKPGTPGPAVGGMALGMEFYDFNGGSGSSIPSQNYIGQNWDASWQSFATHYGGLGFLYPRKWYCVEMRWKMNTLKPYALPAAGTHWLEGGHNVDGFVEWWVDGIPAAKTPLFAHRSSAAIVDWALQNQAGVPFDTTAGSPDRFRGISNVPPDLFMGAASAVFNCYYGGRTFNESNKFVYINGIVCSNGQYIGPMAGVSRANGGLG